MPEETKAVKDPAQIADLFKSPEPERGGRRRRVQFTTAERLREFVSRYRFQWEAAEAIGIGQSTLSVYLSKNRCPKWLDHILETEHGVSLATTSHVVDVPVSHREDILLVRVPADKRELFDAFASALGLKSAPVDI